MNKKMADGMPNAECRMAGTKGAVHGAEEIVSRSVAARKAAGRSGRFDRILTIYSKFYRGHLDFGFQISDCGFGEGDGAHGVTRPVAADFGLRIADCGLGES